ncbi:hypothetical protein C3488_08260 [Streptomyces sp. Ru72]|nr:hypothetical protein C3488_08260 [Streptomyces sp. Ru72]
MFDLTGFVDNFYRPDARAYEKARATQRGFVTAARRGWFGDDGSQTEVFMVQFRSTRGARSMYADLTASWKQNSLATFTDSAVQGEGSVAEKPDSLGNVRVEVAAVRGDVFVRISRFTDATADKAAAEAVLQRQIDSLGGSSSATG